MSCRRGLHPDTPENTVVNKATGARLCRECRRARNRGSEAARNRALKAEAVAAFGGVCANCGSRDRLSLDHVDGDGYEHRREITGDGRRGDRRFLRALKLADWETDYRLQVLCDACHREKTAEEQRAPLATWTRALGRRQLKEVA